ncbi:MAG: four helix bundle protein [Calditrichaeota bacterium]|nr:MAG: four helix bundle protein [Calditrichota bacterium]
MAQKENLLTRVEDFMVWFLPHLERFPRNYKFLIGDEAVRVLLRILEQLTDAYFSKHKLAQLGRANIELEKLRRILSVCMRMRFISAKQLAFASNRLYEIGNVSCFNRNNNNPNNRNNNTGFRCSKTPKSLFVQKPKFPEVPYSRVWHVWKIGCSLFLSGAPRISNWSQK